jgi:aminodeoxyfutalosine deaminase
LYEIINMTMGWLRHPEDLTHVTYELGVSLSRQNVRYAEVSVNPIRFTESGWTFEQFLAAINDGRDRAERGWGVKMRWILAITRDQPRHADEVIRWASSASGQNNGIVGVDLSGPEAAQPIGQFERAFRTAAKKDLPRFVQAGETSGAVGTLEALQQLDPTDLVDGWGSAESSEIRDLLAEKSIPIHIGLTRALRQGWVQKYADYPLQTLLDDDLNVLLSSPMPSYYQTGLADEYLMAVEHCGLSVEAIEHIALNAVHACHLAPAEKAALAETFTQEYASLREEHLAEQQADT